MGTEPKKKSTPFTASIRLRSLDADFLQNPSIMVACGCTSEPFSPYHSPCPAEEFWAQVEHMDSPARRRSQLLSGLLIERQYIIYTLMTKQSEVEVAKRHWVHFAYLSTLRSQEERGDIISEWNETTSSG